MITTFIRFAGLGSLALLLACGDLPDAPAEDRRIVTLEVSHGCTSILEGQSCPVTARAWNTSGEEISSPVVLWRSSRPSVARVEGTGGTVHLLGVRAGHATIRASDTTGRISEQFETMVQAGPSSAGGP